MALSNWDTLAFGPDGKSCDGRFHSHKNKSVLEIYKNWAHIGNKDMWVDNGSLCEPWIASLTEGDCSIGPFSIRAVRHEGQNSMFIYAEETIYSPDYGRDPKAPDPVTRRFAGIGCYGYKNSAKVILERLGRTEDLANFDKFEWMHSSTHENGKRTDVLEKIDISAEPYKIIEVIPMDFDYDDLDLWEGVSPETLKAFFAWLRTEAGKSKDFNAWIDSCESGEALRFNQGDAFFAGALKMNLPATPVNSSEKPEPMMSQALKGNKNAGK